MTNLRRLQEAMKNADIMSIEYKAALAKHDRAIAEFHAVRDLYRAGKVEDSQFLDAKAVYDAATAEFDVAFAKESELNGEVK